MILTSQPFDKFMGISSIGEHESLFSFFFSIYFCQLEANYFTILQWFLSYIDMNQPWIYMCSPSRSPPHLPLHPIPLGLPSAPGLSTCLMHPAWDGDLFTLDSIHVSMLFSRNIPPSPSLTESKILFCTFVSLFLFCIQGYCYHLSKFHIYVLLYCIGVYLSGLLHSV